jgi:hypothetical protein
MDALIIATLVLDGRCLYLQNPGGRVLVLWPAGATLARIDGNVAVQLGGRTFPVGEEMRAGGGEVRNTVLEQVDGDIIEECVTDPVWVMSPDFS